MLLRYYYFFFLYDVNIFILVLSHGLLIMLECNHLMRFSWKRNISLGPQCFGSPIQQNEYYFSFVYLLEACYYLAFF